MTPRRHLHPLGAPRPIPDRAWVYPLEPKPAYLADGRGCSRNNRLGSGPHRLIAVAALALCVAVLWPSIKGEPK